MESTKPILLLFAMQFFSVHAELQNCTSAPCDLKTCQSTSSQCHQICSATPCKTSCQSSVRCLAECPVGGCSKMECNVPGSRKTECEFRCKNNCVMNCKAPLCYPKCAGGNCKIRCEPPSTTASSGCYARCDGGNCEIDCLAEDCELGCDGGNCTVRFSKVSFGTLACGGGNCTLICAKGKSCHNRGGCSSCTKKFVDDPFAPPQHPNSAEHNLATVHLIIFCFLTAALSKFF